MNDVASQPHPLHGVDEWECYDQHIAERNKLTSAKREAEDGFVKTIIQLSSAIVLSVLAVLSLNKAEVKEPSYYLIGGIILVSLSLLCALSEQFLSSLAYEKQIAKTDAYYTRKSSDITPPKISHCVRAFLASAFALFLLGICVISSALLTSPWRNVVAQSPAPRPTPTPSPQPKPYHDSPGRSVPPTPPPTPPTSPRR